MRAAQLTQSFEHPRRRQTLDYCADEPGRFKASIGGAGVKHRLQTPTDFILLHTSPDMHGSASRARLLSGRPPSGRADGGRTVCACFNVGRNTLLDAIRRRGLTSVEALGTELGAGTNCGSCLPELRALLAEAAAIPAPSGGDRLAGARS